VLNLFCVLKVASHDEIAIRSGYKR
jgi:hypothetical protein